MTDEDKELRTVNFKAPKEAYERAKEKLEFGEMSEELRGRVKEIAYGAETTRREELRENLASLRSEKRERATEINNLQEKQRETDRKIERVEMQLDKIRDTDSEYNGALEMLESELQNGNRVFPQHDGVERAANIAQKPKQEVIADLQERNPDVPSHAFELSAPHEPHDWREIDD